MEQDKKRGERATKGKRRPTSEILAGKELLSDRIAAYLPPAEILAIKPSPLDLKLRDEFRKNRPGDDWALVYYPPEEKYIIVPSAHPLNRLPDSSNTTVYGTGSMETLSFEPVLDENKNVTGANIVLLNPRMNRLYDRALPAREVQLPIPRETLRQGIVDLMSVLGKGVLVGKDGKIGIGSIRVGVGPGMGKFGKRAVGQEVFASVESYNTQKDFKEEAYNGKGIVVSAGPDQRTTPFRGKHASHYGDAPRIAEVAKRLGANDAVEFAQYFAKNPSRTAVLDRITDPKELEQTMLNLALANGLGAELMAVRKEDDGSETLLLPPMDVKRLGGVTAQYIVDHMAPKMGIKTEITPFSLQDILDGKIVGLFFAGNAARIAEINTVRLHDADEKVLRDIKIPVPDIVNRLVDQFEKEVTGIVPPSDPSLITKVDLVDGEKARKVLDEAFAAWR